MAQPSSVTAANVGGEVLAFCTFCKMDMMNVVVAMKGEKIAKVKCKTCEKDHVYRAPKGITEPPPKKVKLPKGVAASVPVEMEWEKLMAVHKNTPFKSYSMKGQFLLGDKLQHPSFGDGIVSKQIYPNKIEVIFKADIKVLIHGGVATT